MGQCIDALPIARQFELPQITESERQRLDAVHPAGDGDKAVHQGMLATVWPLEAMDLEDCIAGLGEGPVRLLLDQLSDPRNVGAIMRSALALGAQAIITTHRNAPRVRRWHGRRGALERVPMIRVVNLARAMSGFRKRDRDRRLAADGDSDVGSLREISLYRDGSRGTGCHLTAS